MHNELERSVIWTIKHNSFRNDIYAAEEKHQNKKKINKETNALQNVPEHVPQTWLSLS